MGVRRYIFVCVACNYRMLDDNGDALLELYLLGAYRCMDSWYYVTVGDIVRRWSSSLTRSQSQVDRYTDTQSDSRFFPGIIDNRSRSLQQVCMTRRSGAERRLLSPDE